MTPHIDVREHFPGTVVITATIDGAPAAGYAVIGESTAPASNETRRVRAVVGTDGVAHLGAVLPGTWHFGLAPTDRAWWTAWTDARVEIAANRESKARVDVTLASGTLHTLSATTGTALANRSIRCALANGSSTTFQTDAEGRLTARVPAGRYTFADAGDGASIFTPGTAVEVEWTVAGPVPAEIRLEPAKPLDIKLPRDG